MKARLIGGVRGKVRRGFASEITWTLLVERFLHYDLNGVDDRSWDFVPRPRRSLRFVVWVSSLRERVCTTLVRDPQSAKSVSPAIGASTLDAPKFLGGLLMDPEANWKQLLNVYSEEGIALALGAGVSVKSKLPAWDELLRRIAKKCLKENEHQLVDVLISEGFSLPSIAGILEGQCPDRKFVDLLRDALYDDFKKFYRIPSVEDDPGFVDFIKATNLTLCAVAALCAIKTAKGKYERNPSIHAIANTNFDAILRVYSRYRHHRHVMHTIDRPSAGAVPGAINVYHLHGFFQFEKKYIDNPEKEAPDIRVFTEHEFFDFFNQPNSRFSYTFLHVLREFSTLFIGMSLKDDNIRRLLHYSRKETIESYIKENRPAEAEDKALRHYAFQQHSKSQDVDRFVEASLLRLGVRTLWVDKFDEIPTKLQELYESKGAAWSDVY